MSVVPTLLRFAGRCPRGGLFSLGAARRKIVTLPLLRSGSLLSKSRNNP